MMFTSDPKLGLTSIRELFFIAPKIQILFAAKKTENQHKTIGVSNKYINSSSSEDGKQASQQKKPQQQQQSWEHGMMLKKLSLIMVGQLTHVTKTLARSLARVDSREKIIAGNRFSCC